MIAQNSWGVNTLDKISILQLVIFGIQWNHIELELDRIAHVHLSNSLKVLDFNNFVNLQNCNTICVPQLPYFSPFYPCLAWITWFSELVHLSSHLGKEWEVRAVGDWSKPQWEGMI